MTLLFTSSLTHAARFVIESKHELSDNELLKVKGFKIERLANIEHPYFSRAYVVSGKVSKEELEELSWVKNVELTPELTQFSLEPAENSEALVADELFSYQWGLLNQGQIFYREKDDVHNIPMKGIQNKDIGWRNLFSHIPERRAVVAVLDSGVDLNHPELQNNLWKNENECGKDPSIDNDKNRLPGDCHGWNFTEDIASPEAKSPQDTDGHGTHVAGIIAAGMNESGIVGVNPNALIMPVKVMKDANSKSEIASSESFARGIIYATDNGADVINMSLGWPRSLETKYLKEAIYYALSQGVVIVAAAGNNNSNEPLFPCAYDGVICTAASTLNGNFAGFSNFGGHIDTIAPGEAILSLAPVIYEPEFFAVPGFDIKSGTSQSAPMVAGLISILKAENKQISVNEIFGRIYSGRQNQDKKKYILGGEANWESLSKKVETPVVRPILKRIRQILTSGERAETKLIVPVRNYGLNAEGIQVKVEGLSSGVEFDSAAQVIEMLNHAEVKDLTFPVRITDFTAENNIKIKITIIGPEGEMSFLNEIPVSRDIRSDASVKKLPFSFAAGRLPVGMVKDGAVYSALSTLDSYVKSEKHEFFMKRTLKEEKKLELTLFRRVKNSYVEVPRKIDIENALNLVNFIRVDLTMDGKEDYVVQTLSEDEEGRHLAFAFFDENLNPLWTQYKSAKVVLDVGIADMNSLSFIRFNHPELGKILVPAFFTEGQIPASQQSPDFMNRYDLGKELRLYYLEPDVSDKKLLIKTLTGNTWKDQVKKEVKGKWYDTVMVEKLLPVSSEDAKNGDLRVIFSVGYQTKRQIFISTFNTRNSQRGNALPQLVLQTEDVDALYSVTASGLESVGEVYFNIYDRSRSKIVTTKGSSQNSELVYKHESETDLIAGHLVSFEDGQKKFSVLQTRDELIALGITDGKMTTTSRPKLRYSFLTSKFLSEMYNPVIYKRNGKQAPALYVDSTSVTLNRINLFEEQNGKLVSSIRNSLLVPVNCRAMNPRFSQESQSHEFVLLCVDTQKKDWFIHTLEMK